MATSELTEPSVSGTEGSVGRSSRLPILLGVFLGMVAWMFVVPIVERPVSELIFGVPPGKQAWATPGYYCIHRTLLLLLSAAGGTIGLFLSPMRKRYAILMLVGLLAVIAVVATLFPR
jgi:hypothetical protein